MELDESEKQTPTFRKEVDGSEKQMHQQPTDGRRQHTYKDNCKSEIDSLKNKSLVVTLSSVSYDWKFLPDDLFDIFEIKKPTIKPISGRLFLLTFESMNDLDLIMVKKEFTLWDCNLSFSYWKPVLKTLPATIIQPVKLCPYVQKITVSGIGEDDDVADLADVSPKDSFAFQKPINLAYLSKTAAPYPHADPTKSFGQTFNSVNPNLISGLHKPKYFADLPLTQSSGPHQNLQTHKINAPYISPKISPMILGPPPHLSTESVFFNKSTPSFSPTFLFHVTKSSSSIPLPTINVEDIGSDTSFKDDNLIPDFEALGAIGANGG